MTAHLGNMKRMSVGGRNISSLGINVHLASAQSSGKYTDVTFTFPESSDLVVKAHKLILALSSPVFDLMFYSGHWDNNSLIQIDDIEFSSFKIFIEFLYFNQLPQDLSVNQALKIWHASSKYCVEDLEAKITAFLKDSITLDTSLTILKSAILFDNAELAKMCWNCVDLDADRIILTEEFLSTDELILSQMLDREKLAITEIKLFTAILRWGEFQCESQNEVVNIQNLRSVLQRLLKKIRFPSMDATEFSNGPAISGLLTEEEISNIMITKFSTIDAPSVKMFSPKPRDKMTKRLECHCRQKFPCSFCKDRKNDELPKERYSINMFQSPSCYCGCRMQGYCPVKTVL